MKKGVRCPFCNRENFKNFNEMLVLILNKTSIVKCPNCSQNIILEFNKASGLKATKVLRA